VRRSAGEETAREPTELERLRQSLEFLRKEADLVGRLSRAPSVDALLEDVLAYIKERWGFELIGVQLIDPARRVLRGYRTYGKLLDAEAQAAVSVDVQLDPHASVSAWVAVRQRPLYVHPQLTARANASAVDRRAAAALGVVEALMVPVVEEGQTLGVVHVSVCRSRPPLDKAQIAEVEAFMLGMTAPIRGLLAREALERSRREQAELAALCQRISASIELDQLLGLLGEQVLADGQFDGYFVSLPDAVQNALSCRHIHLPAEFAGMHSAYAELRQPLDAVDPLVDAYRQGVSLVVREADLERWPSLRHRFQRWRIHSAAVLPILLDQRPVGVVFAFRQQQAIDVDRMRWLEQRLPLFSAQIRNALFYADLRQREKEIAAAAAERQRFLSLVHHLIELTDPEQIYRLITAELLAWLPFDLAGIVLREGQALAVKHISVRDQELEPLREAWQAFYQNRPFRLDPTDGATVFAYVHDTPVLIPDVMQVLHLPMSSSDRDALALMETPRTFLFLPIRRGDEPIGVLWLISARQPVELPEGDVKLIQALCAVIGTAIGNAELYATVEQQRREIETALRELRETQQQLATAKAAAEASAAAKSAFVANTSHEIRTPLTAIIGFAETLLEQMGAGSEPGQAAGAILRNGHHLLQLINDILDLSKIEAGRLEFARIPYSPADIVQDVATTMTLLARDKGLYFHVRASSPIPQRVLGDPARVRQALLNLCNNAVKFTDIGGVRVDVDCDPTAERLRVRVQDTGIGIRAEDQDKLFQPFTQVEDAVSRRYGGTGLGLAITRQLIEGMGGRVSATSMVGKGSTFEVTVPTGPLQDVPMHEPRFDADLPLVEAAQGLTAIRLRGRVLVADDSRDNRLLIQHYLDQLGLQSVLVENGQQAVTTALASAFDLLILDIQMPGMSGVEALATLRSCGFGKPIVALTANVMPTDVERYRDSGFDACLGKPIDRRQFAQTLQRYLPAAGPTADRPQRVDLAALSARFVHELPDRLKLLEGSLEHGQWERLANEAHKLKGTASVFGWHALGEAVAEIEALVRTVSDNPARRRALEEALRRAAALVQSPS
jgi:signal transduction histidine kinase/FixJ family two-component response regulator